MKHLSLIILFLFYFRASLLFGLSVTSSVSGIWNDAEYEETDYSQWSSAWIWLDDAHMSDMMLARRAFQMDAIPAVAHLKISASSVYQLYINGQYVSRGPARSAPHHQSYDLYDIASILQSGENIIAIRVHYQEGTVSYEHQGRAGLICQLNWKEGDEACSITTDSDWRMTPDPSWLESSPLIARFHPEVCDRVDMNKRESGWTKLSYDDSDWLMASILYRNTGWPGRQRNDPPQVLLPPWTKLELRDIPYLEEQTIAATELIAAIPLLDGHVEHKQGKGKQRAETPPFVQKVKMDGTIDPAIADTLSGFPERKSPIALSPKKLREGWVLVFDLDSVVNGFPRLDIRGGEGAVVDIMSAPYILDETFTANNFDSQLIDRIILSGKRERWEAMYFKPTRYLAIVIHPSEEGTQLYDFGIRKQRYPFVERGSIEIEKGGWIESFWKASQKTIEVCTTDAYTDNYRERRQYIQTGYYATLGNYWIFGDFSLQRRLLKQIAEEQLGNGVMPAYAPRFGDDYMVMLESNFFWLRGLSNYLLYSGDEESVRQLMPTARKLVDFLSYYTNSLGLIDSPPYAYWLDHARNDRRGANFCFNGHYLGALEDYAEVLQWLGEDAAPVRLTAKKLRSSLREFFWNEKKGLFCDATIKGKQSRMFSEHANAMALAVEVATAEQAKRIASHLLKDDWGNSIRRDSGTIVVTPAMSYYLHDGLCSYGYVDESLNLFRERFSKMLDPKTNQTLWEEWWIHGTGRSGKWQAKTRSDAQTESAFPPALFARYVCGVQVIQPGMRTIKVSKPGVCFGKVESTIPAPMGDLIVKWDLNNNLKGNLTLNIPEGMNVIFESKNFGVGEHLIPLK